MRDGFGLCEISYVTNAVSPGYPHVLCFMPSLHACISSYMVGIWYFNVSFPQHRLFFQLLMLTLVTISEIAGSIHRSSLSDETIKWGLVSMIHSGTLN